MDRDSAVLSVMLSRENATRTEECVLCQWTFVCAVPGHQPTWDPPMLLDSVHTGWLDDTSGSRFCMGLCRYLMRGSRIVRWQHEIAVVRIARQKSEGAFGKQSYAFPTTIVFCSSTRQYEDELDRVSGAQLRSGCCAAYLEVVTHPDAIRRNVAVGFRQVTPLGVC